MSIKVDPRSPVLWVRARGLAGKTVQLTEVCASTPLDPSPRPTLLRALHGSDEGVVHPVALTLDAAKTRLTAACLRVFAVFPPDDPGAITVELFAPGDAHGATLPAPLLVLRLTPTDDAGAVESIDLEHP